jgi:leucyl-tRNA synthetase
MQLLNTVSKVARSEHGIARVTLDEAIDTMLKLLAPMAPHVTAEIWESRNADVASVHLQPWPEADSSLVVDDTVTMIIQVNGKNRSRLDIAVTTSEAEAEALALADPTIISVLDGALPKRVVARPPRLVNIIV